MAESASSYSKIIVPKRLHVDTIVAALLLKEYGDKMFPGISGAMVEFVRDIPDDKSGSDLEKEGEVVLGMGGGRFDRLRKTRADEQVCVSVLVARYLGMEDDPALNKILSFANRDSIEGKGILSDDRIDRAFGFSGLFHVVARDHADDPKRVFETFEPILLAHLRDERTRKHILPKEYMMQYDAGHVEAFVSRHRGKEIRCIIIKSDRKGMPGFLRSHPSIRADVIAQQLSSGHTNIVTRQDLHLDMRDVAAYIRLGEAAKRRIAFDSLKMAALTQEKPMEKLPMWELDASMCAVQNGGMDPGDLESTKMSFRDLKQAIEAGLDPYSVHPGKETCSKKCRYAGYRRHRELFRGGSSGVSRPTSALIRGMRQFL